MKPVMSLSNTWKPRQYSSGSPGSRNPPGRFRTFWKESKSTVNCATRLHISQCFPPLSIMHVFLATAYSPRQHPSPTRVSRPALDSARMLGGDHLGILERRGRCHAYRTGRRLLCSLWMPVERGFSRRWRRKGGARSDGCPICAYHNWTFGELEFGSLEANR